MKDAQNLVTQPQKNYLGLLNISNFARAFLSHATDKMIESTFRSSSDRDLECGARRPKRTCIAYIIQNERLAITIP